LAEPNENTPAVTNAPEGQATTQAQGTEVATMKAQLESLLKHKAELEADLQKYRKRNEADAQKAKEAGDFAKLLDMEKESRAALEAQLKELSPLAEIGKLTADRAAKEIEEAKADSTIPSFVRKALEAVKSPLDAADILREFRSSVASTPATKTTTIAPAQGAPAAASPSKTLAQMSPEEIMNAPLDDLRKATGMNGSDPGKSFFSRFIPQ
jgi:hypothetical protein